MADSAFDPSLLNPLSGPLLDVFGAPFSNTPWSAPGNMNDLSQLLQLNIAPVSSSPLFNVGTPYSTPLVGPLSTPPQTVYSTPINFDYLSSFTNLSNDTSAMDFTNNSIGTSPPTFIHPFAPAVDPATAGFVPLAWTPPTLPGEYHPQATLTGWGSRRHHPYLRERAITPMVPSDSDSDDEVHEEKIHAPQAGETPHWAAGLGPNDWPEQVKREPPYAPPPETTELWIYYNNKTMKELAIARARKLEEDAGAGRGGKLERSFSEAQFKEIVSEEDKRGIKHAELGFHRSHKKNHKEPSHVFSNAFNALKSLLSGAPPPPPKENPPPEPSLSSPSSPSSSSSRRKSGMFNRPRSSMDMLRRSFSMSRPPRPASSASINELASQSDNTVVDRSMTSPTPDLTYIDDERAESPAPPPKDDDDDEILEEILRKLKLSSPVSSPTANVAILPPTPEKDTAGVSGNVITVLRIFRPYIFNDTITKDQDPLNSRGRAIVSAGILKRLVDLKRVDADLVRACARRVAVGLAPVAVERLLAATSSLEDKKVDETMAPEIVFLERLAAVGLLKANLASAVTLTEVDGAYEWNEEV
ncbi:hypothetical protein BC829DRAFT_391109 [Chytridium lagenaria]|nr:hypothetical protein BC829DRAFT_391109 [Chytridium lagenaria]